MRHYFIINPAAGRQSSEKTIIELLNTHKIDASVYLTKNPGDATKYIKSVCKKEPDTLKRFWACGGDGTLNEVVNGIMGFKNTELACYPCGSGNDYVKYFGDIDSFFDMEKQLNGKPMLVDVLEVGGRYAINEINFGFDSVAAYVMQKIKRKPFIGGKNAYMTGVMYALINAMDNPCKVFSGDELLNPTGRILLCTAMCGQYIGGGFRCAPNSSLDDGLIDVTIIKPLLRRKLLSLMKKYKDGSYLKAPELQKYIIYRQLDKIRFEAHKGFSITMDGENVQMPEGEIRLIHKAVKFIVPNGQEEV
ncbi:MAG: YegS/Rv2252/BmrU family lipid kinase [Eubacteriales bacterium]|nr:YegS/Rv2252/BmrU family lipid kinase [Eubacteriales bacterium]